MQLVSQMTIWMLKWLTDINKQCPIKLLTPILSTLMSIWLWEWQVTFKSSPWTHHKHISDVLCAVFVFRGFGCFLSGLLFESLHCVFASLDTRSWWSYNKLWTFTWLMNLKDSGDLLPFLIRRLEQLSYTFFQWNIFLNFTGLIFSKRTPSFLIALAITRHQSRSVCVVALLMYICGCDYTPQ